VNGGDNFEECWLVFFSAGGLRAREGVRKHGTQRNAREGEADVNKPGDGGKQFRHRQEVVVARRGRG